MQTVRKLILNSFQSGPRYTRLEVITSAPFCTLLLYPHPLGMLPATAPQADARSAKTVNLDKRSNKNFMHEGGNAVRSCPAPVTNISQRFQPKALNKILEHVTGRGTPGPVQPRNSHSYGAAKYTNKTTSFQFNLNLCTSCVAKREKRVRAASLRS